MKHAHWYDNILQGLSWLPTAPATIPEAELFPTPLISHCSYHKCLTVFYGSILRSLSSEFGFSYEHMQSDALKFSSQAVRLPGKGVISVNNCSDIDWDKLPPFRGTHFVRDPRDLIVSGYWYHLWTKEAWCVDENFNWRRIVKHPLFHLVEPDCRKYPIAISYQEYLNELDHDRGLMLEILWRAPHFLQMQKWNYKNPHILEMRYEDIVGNEAEMFSLIFGHYGFHSRLRDRGLKLVSKFRLRNRSKRRRGHTRNGSAGQWRHEFTPSVTQLFKQEWNPLLLQLGYERDASW